MSGFLSRPCSLCISFFKWLPVGLIAAIVAWSYYAYVIQLCFFLIENNAEKVAYLLIFHVSFTMFLWSYWQTIFTRPQEVPEDFFLSAEVLDLYAKEQTEVRKQAVLKNFCKNLPVHCRNYNGTIRYCEKCCTIKPDRAHHCSVCSKCVLKMDHHCPWVNNCVCFDNYKFFVLFLGYAILYCVFVAATTCRYFIRFWTAGREGIHVNESSNISVEGWSKLHILFLFFLAVMFAISLISLFCYHCYLVSMNRTTLESVRPPVFDLGPEKFGFYLGRYENFAEVFGDDRNYWFLPLSTMRGNGLEFKRANSAPHGGANGDPELGLGISAQPKHHYSSMGETNLSDSQNLALNAQSGVDRQNSVPRMPEVGKVHTETNQCLLAEKEAALQPSVHVVVPPR